MRLGVDVGGTKIAVAVLDAGGAERLRRRVEYQSREYGAALELLAKEVLQAEKDAGERCSVGLGMPGLVHPDTGLVENAYNTPYNKQPLKKQLEERLGHEVRFANDANCFALSEAVDGAARGARVVFGAILGTGVGGGIVVGGRMLEGRHGIAGEWGHTPLPWMTDEEHPGPRCTCGRLGCIEQFLSGPAKNRERDAIGEAQAMARYEDRLARAGHQYRRSRRDRPRRGALEPRAPVSQRARALGRGGVLRRGAHASRSRAARRFERRARRGVALGRGRSMM